VILKREGDAGKRMCEGNEWMVIVLLSSLGVRVTEPTPIGPTQLISPARIDKACFEARLHSLLRCDDAFLTHINAVPASYCKPLPLFGFVVLQ
jgi:hypothetical protein